MANEAARFSEIPLNDLRDLADLVATVAAAADVGVFASLAVGDAGSQELSERLEVDQRALGILMPILVELGILEATGAGYHLPEPWRSRLGDSRSTEYLAGGLPLWLSNLKALADLPTTLRSGQPARRSQRSRDEAAMKRFLAGMAAAPRARIDRIVAVCRSRCPGARTVLDLGAGPGAMARVFVEDGLQVTMLDTPATIEVARKEYDLDSVDGLTLVASDFTEDTLPRGPFDVVLISNVLHIYGPATCRSVLTQVGQVVRPGGVVAIGEFVRGRSPRAARLALTMLLRTEHGNTYTEDEYRVWLAEAGFGDVEVTDVDPERQLVTGIRTED